MLVSHTTAAQSWRRPRPALAERPSVAAAGGWAADPAEGLADAEPGTLFLLLLRHTAHLCELGPDRRYFRMSDARWLRLGDLAPCAQFLVLRAPRPAADPGAGEIRPKPGLGWVGKLFGKGAG